jgi:hypothetical protein
MRLTLRSVMTGRYAATFISSGRTDPCNSASFTESLKSSVMEYPYENGRRYHAFGSDRCFIPNDEVLATHLAMIYFSFCRISNLVDQLKSDRLDLSSHMLSLLLNGGLHWAPIGQNPHWILDLATGTGIWAIDIGLLHPRYLVIPNDGWYCKADQYPSAEVLGNDISAIQPSLQGQH